jgi:glutathione synthase/RimK-type ligase-like ATP-grasp enzyme
LNNRPLLCQFIDDITDLPSAESNDLKYFLAEKLKVLSPNENFSDKRILMFTRKLDREADLVGIGLLQRGIDYVRLNIDDIPLQLRIRFNFLQDCDLKLEFSIGEEEVNISNFSLAWLRHFNIRKINFHQNKLDHIFALQQWNDACRTLQSNLSCEWISSPHATLQASDRIKQLSVAKKSGFNIPATLITNDPEAASNFYHNQGDEVVLKALHHHSLEIDGKVYSIYTRRLLKQDLSRLDDLIYAPCILQERLHKKSELRVTIVGERVFAAEIDSQSTINGKDDMHRCPIPDLPKKGIKLEETISECCIKLINSFGLRFGAIDFVIDKNERLTFLELNPTGDWYWIEYQTGLPITEAMVDLIEETIRSSRK